MKEGFIILKIRRIEADYLKTIGLGRYVNNGHGSYHHYYLAENSKTLKALAEYQEALKKSNKNSWERW